VPDRKFEYEGDEAEPLAHRPHGGDEGKRLKERLVLEKLTGAVGAVGIASV
jgi:hypothetical protein